MFNVDNSKFKENNSLINIVIFKVNLEISRGKLIMLRLKSTNWRNKFNKGRPYNTSVYIISDIEFDMYQKNLYVDRIMTNWHWGNHGDDMIPKAKIVKLDFQENKWTFFCSANIQ